MTRYQITFAWPNEDWTWIDVKEASFHAAICTALSRCPASCRIVRIENLDAWRPAPATLSDASAALRDC